MSESDDQRIERASELLERLMSDPEFRSRFRAGPEAACREAGFAEVADEIRQAGGALQTLEVRESRSSLLGVLMAAAFEGMGALELANFAGSSGLGGEAADIAHRALTRAGLRSVHPAAGMHGPHLQQPHVPGVHQPHVPGVPQPHVPGVHQPHVPGVPQPHVPHLQQPHLPHGGQVPGAGAAGAGGGPADAGAATPGSAAAPGAGVDSSAGGGASSASAGAGGGGSSAAAASPGGAGRAPAGGAGAGSGGGAWPDQAGGGGGGQGAWPDAAHGQSGAAADSVAGGAPGEGGAAAELVQNPQLTIPPNAQAALLSGQADSRIAPLLDTLASKHKLGLRTVSGGRVEIVSVDGKPVTPTNTGARELMSEIADLDPAARPSHVGGPWPISAPGFTSGATHEQHIQLTFSPAGVAWGDPSAAAAGAPAGVAGAGAVSAADPSAAGAGAPAGVAGVPAAAPAGVVADPSAAGAGAAPAGAGAFGAAPGAGHGTIQFTAAPDPSQLPAGVHAVAASATDQPAGSGSAAADAAAAAVDPAPPGGGFDMAAAGQDYPGNGASKAQLAAWMGRWAERAGLPRQLPVMASLVESGLTNVQYGDADSLGFFQMRTSIWSGQYPDFQHHPEQQLKWFIDEALAVQHQRLASGQTAFQHDPNQFGDWIADIERPAAEYRGRYQLRLDHANGLLGQAAAAPPSPAVAAPTPPVASAAAATAGPGGAQPPHGTISFTAVAPQDPSAAPAGAVGAASAAVDPGAAGGSVMVPGENVTVPGTAPDELRKIFERASELDHRELPYVYGGGHHAGGVIDVNTTGPVDCSATVSAVLGVDTRVSGAFESYGEAGPGKYVTIYANPEHVLMEINGHFFGTSASNPGGGAGWIPREHIPSSYLAGFVVRHPTGM